MSNQISTSAQSARENARASDGRFGQQEHDRADDLALFESLPQEVQDQIMEWTHELDAHGKLWLTEGDLGPEVGPNTDIWIRGDDDTGLMVMSMAIDVPTDDQGKDVPGIAAFAEDHGYTYKQELPGLSTLTTNPVPVGVDPDKIRETMEQVDPGGKMRNDLAATVKEHNASAADSTPFCNRHGGAWGGDETCEQCTDDDGNPRPQPADTHDGAASAAAAHT